MPGEVRRRALHFLVGASALAVAQVTHGGDRTPALDVADQRLLRLSDRGTIPFAEVIEDVKRVPLVLVGELHDQPSHHWAQLQVIRALHEAEVRAAVGLEMFRAADQETLDAWVRGELSQEAFVAAFLESWGPPWELYADIFLYCREHEIPMIGLNLPREITHKVAREGFASLPPEQTRGLPAVTCDVDEVYEQFLRLSMNIPSKEDLEYEHFCEAQLVWDSVMARNSARFLERHPGTTLVVLAGSGHAWKRGIPARIRRPRRAGFRVILPETEEEERSQSTVDDADYLWLDLPTSP